MLQTGYKARLPKGWSYPVGAELLSRALDGVAGATPNALHFSDYRIRNRHDRQQREQDVPYRVLSVGYSGPHGDAEIAAFAAQGLTDGWQIKVDPVPSDRRAWVRACIVAEGLPRIRSWLLRAQVAIAQQGRGGCSVLYHEGRERLLFKEWRNNFDDPTTTELACTASV
jgi:hypothetical protein